MTFKNIAKTLILLTGLITLPVHAGSEAKPILINTSCSVNNFNGNANSYVAI